MHDTYLIYLLPMHDRIDSNQEPISAASRLKGFNCCALSALSHYSGDWSAKFDRRGGGTHLSVTRCPGTEAPDAAGSGLYGYSTSDF